MLAAGGGLSEFEFPPHSGTNVIFHDGGPISIEFASLVTTFSAFATYASPLTLEAYDAGNVLLGSVTSSFTNNTVSSGNPPNELLQLTFAGGISSVQLAGFSAGDSFVVDDVTFVPLNDVVPEPASLTLLGLGLAGMAGRRWRQRKRFVCTRTELFRGARRR